MNNAKNTTLFPYLERLLEGEAVEWKTLGEVCDYIRGITYNKSAETTEVDGWKVLRANNITLETRKLNFNEVKHVKKTIRVRENQMLRKGDILICAGSGSKEHIGKTAYIESDIDYTFGGFMGVLRLKEEKTISSRYLFHYIGSGAFTTYLGATLKSSTINNLNNGIISPFTIPVPSLRVQARIVEILDKFTQLEAELEAELEARKKQYAYYRDQLLNFSQCPPLNVNIEWKTLGEVMDVVTDFTAAGSFASNAQNVRYLQEPNYALLVRTTDIKQGFKSTEKFIYVDQHAFEYLWRVNMDKECIILPNVGNCGEVYHSSPTILPYKNCVLGPNAILVRSEKASNKFLYYLFQAEYFQKELAKITSNIGQGKFNKTNLKQIKLPLPPLSEQRRIVDILDRFDTLTNSISEGLPKEIALRRKQYEYYRDALLSFPRAEVTA